MLVSLVELLELLDAHKGAMIVTMTTKTQPKLLAKSRATGESTAARFPGGIDRLAYGRFMLASNYGDNVQAQREREGHDNPEGFEAAGLWASKKHPEGAGRHFGRFMVIHADKPGTFYFRCRPHADEHGHPVKIRSEYRAQDTEITGDDLDDLTVNYLPAKGSAYKQQVDKEIPYRAYEIAGVQTVTFGGETYELDHEGETPEWIVPELATA